jgi:hypothetical protein
VALAGAWSMTPMPWGGLWLAVPAAVALALLVAWRFGLAGLLVPVALAAAVVPAARTLGGADTLAPWWLPAGALTGAWMGLREEGGGARAGERGRVLLPVLLLAACLPWTAHYAEMVSRVDRELRAGDAQLVEIFRQLGSSGERLRSLERAVSENAALRLRALPHALPVVLFVWMALLTAAGRALASRAAAVLRWPALARARLADWRLPDAAVWLFLAGLALLVARWPAWGPTAWALLVNVGLGYCVQGVAVVESLLLARGIPPSIVVLSLLFVFAMATPVFMLITACVGLSDVWLDYRRLEPSPDGD